MEQVSFELKKFNHSRHIDDRYEKIYSRFSSKTVAALYQFTLQGFLVLFTSIPLYYIFKDPTILKPGLLGLKNITCLAIVLFGIGG